MNAILSPIRLRTRAPSRVSINRVCRYSRPIRNWWFKVAQISSASIITRVSWRKTNLAISVTLVTKPIKMYIHITIPLGTGKSRTHNSKKPAIFKNLKKKANSWFIIITRLYKDLDLRGWKWRHSACDSFWFGWEIGSTARNWSLLKSDTAGNLDDMGRIYYYKHYINNVLKGRES